MTNPLNHFILKFSPNRRKIRVIAGYPHKKMSIILRIFLGVQQDFRIKHIDLKSGSPIFSVPS